MPQPMLEGEYVDTSSREDLLAENKKLYRIITRLRTQLNPLYTALQGVFGEFTDLDLVEGMEDMSRPDVPVRVSAVWEDWKKKVPQPSGRIIDALLTHGELNTQQLAVAASMHRNNVPKYIWHLNKAGLIDKNGGRYSLKKL